MWLASNHIQRPWTLKTEKSEKYAILCSGKVLCSCCLKTKEMIC